MDREVPDRLPMDALAMGIETIYQDLALAENPEHPGDISWAGKMKKALGFSTCWTTVHAGKAEGPRKLDILIPSLRKPQSAALSGGSARQLPSPAPYTDAKFLIMDEPTAALGVAEHGRRSSPR